MARLAAFPKAWLNDLGAGGTMMLREWIEMSRAFDIDGLEFYAGFRELADAARWSEFRRQVEDQGLCIPMLCCSPDFTHPDPFFRREQIDFEKRWIDMAAGLGAEFCRVLSGQRRPDVSRADGIRFAADAIAECRRHAAERGVTLILENHYKDGFWVYPEFAQRIDVFLDLLREIPEGIDFGVNFDPSNCVVCGEDPIELLEAVKGRVVTMHASDRYFEGGTLADLQRLDQDPRAGYATILKHGVIGRGLNDYDRIFSILHGAGFDGWISIEDGADPGTTFEDIRQSALFLRRKMAEHGLGAHRRQIA
ncbi:MAG TPA: sugar phosphate isomerase/epimerase family protein [Opitutaceae bacterium]|nr:sugar phosphate isomerase/epimerase family protein [Opitutaceae bacterium]